MGIITCALSAIIFALYFFYCVFPCADCGSHHQGLSIYPQITPKFLKRFFAAQISHLINHPIQLLPNPPKTPITILICFII
ncbi:Putative hypothetical protein [Helicobacter mustelae 12198]|uniref:Uncharacterized protein n=1 Tax=Helicobacter mustelae (strain ATCC 43772 / CCUG 25715 / CIP 103759 / LMG 18044 / NCTC 12198 / R85-136P) TaxID=679897 RepID=D3UGP3_HELM1|nr:Putative hypothetical protein [Helicobacter mustelae 12198]